MGKTAGQTGAYLHHIAIESENPENLAKFYSSAMDMKSKQLSNGCWTCVGAHRKLVISKGSNNKLSYAAFACQNKASMEALCSRVKLQGINILSSPSHYFHDDAFAISDPNGNLICFGVEEDSNAINANLHAPLQHLTFASLDVEMMVDFYVEKLGFSLSDRVLHENGDLATAFMTSNHEHHTIACFKADYNGIDHHSYEAGDWMYIRDWCDHFATQDIQLIWGPGRHGPGNNLFIFIEDLDRNWIEISAELEVVVDRPTLDWPQHPRTLNKWGRAIMRS